MKKICLFIFLLYFTNVQSAIVLPTNYLLCTNLTSNKQVKIKPYHKIILWYKNDANEIEKIRVFVKEFVDNKIVCSKSLSRRFINISLQNIVAISKRQSENLIIGSAGVATTGTALTAIYGLLNRVSKSSLTPNESRGFAGVVGIVLAIVTTPLFILSNYTFFKQLSHKKMDINTGWKFTILD